MRRDDTLRQTLIVTTTELEDAWNPRDEWGAFGPAITDDEEWAITRRDGGYALERRDQEGGAYIAFADLMSAEDIREIGPGAERFVDEVENSHNAAPM